MTGIENIAEMADKLRYYDVDQKGWEHEGLGFTFNASHVLKHLTKDIIRKDFSDPKVAVQAIAPDAVQYALRLGRWTNQNVQELLPIDGQAQAVYALSGRFAQMPHSQIAYMFAVATLGEGLHDLDHAAESEQATLRIPEVARTTAGLLIFCANQLSHLHRFSVDEVFDNRLMELRDRFAIPHPENPVA